MKTETSEALSHLKVLLIDDDPDIHTLVSGFWESQPELFQLEWAVNLEEGIHRLHRQKPDVVLLDLHLPGSRGLDTFRTFKSSVHSVPIVVMTSLDDDKCALQTLREGAQDYLVKGHINGRMLMQILRYAVERHQLQEASLITNLIDDETQFYNRKGFTTLSEQHLKSAHRTKSDLLIFLAVINGYEKINEEFGPSESHNALSAVARILKESFRRSDIICRLGANRFAVILSDFKSINSKIIHYRLEKNQTYYDSQFNRYKLSLSLGTVRIDSAKLKTSQDLMGQLDNVFDRYAGGSEMENSQGNYSRPN